MRKLGANPEIKDVLRALEDLSRDLDAVRSGRLKIGSDIDMRGYKLTGLPTPVDASDAQPKIGDMTGEFAPLNSAYAVVGNLDGDLPNERLLAGSSSITLTDGGSGSTLAISATQAFFDALYQPLDATLTSLAALGTAADRYAYTTGIDTWAEGTITAFARTILDDADAAAVRATIGAGTGGGSVTSVDGSGGTTGLTLTGGPITTTGTLTLGGTLAVANGGTGTTTGTTLQAAYTASTSPEILTDATRVALSLKRGSGSDSDNVLEILTGAGATSASLKGDGTLTSTIGLFGSTTPTTSYPLNAYSASNFVSAFQRDTSSLTGTSLLLNRSNQPAPLYALEYAQFDDSGATQRSTAYWGATLTARGASAVTGAFIVATNNNTSTTLTERMRIDHNGLDLETPLAVTEGGTGRATSTTAYGLLAAGTTATGAHQTLAAGATTEILVGGGAAALPVWTTATGTGAPVRATSPTLVTPTLGVAVGTSLALGISPAEGLLHISDADFADTALFERTTTGTSSMLGALRVLATTSGASADGFGAAISLGLRDSSGATINQLVQVGAQRAGADNTGRFVVGTNVAGVAADRFYADNAALFPATAGGIALGKVTGGFSSLFLDDAASGRTVQFVSPTIGGDIVLTTPAVTGTLATLAGTETLTNKTLTDPIIANVNGGGNLQLQSNGSGSVNVILSDTFDFVQFGDTASLQIGTFYGSAATVPGLSIEQGSISVKELSANPSAPTNNVQARMYLKADNLVFQFNNAGTTRYLFIPLSGTGTTWTHDTTGP